MLDTVTLGVLLVTHILFYSLSQKHVIEHLSTVVDLDLIPKQKSDHASLLKLNIGIRAPIQLCVKRRIIFDKLLLICVGLLCK